jgi:histidine triad (HIT) family protein
VLRTEKVVAFFPTEPATTGHTLVVPRDPFPDIWSIDRDTAHAVTEATLKVAHAVRRATLLTASTVIQSNGEVATQSVFHVHVHVVPRLWDDIMDIAWPSKPNWSDAALDVAHDQIRLQLSRA